MTLSQHTRPADPPAMTNVASHAHPEVATSTAPHARGLWVRRGLLFLFIATITLISQLWVGASTVYSEQYEQRRLDSHQVTLDNKLPAGTTWRSRGANGTNIRVVSVFAAEWMHQVAHISVLKAYRLIDTVSLFSTLLLLFVYLRRWFDNLYSLVGVFFVGITLPLTYVPSSFHPGTDPRRWLWLVALFLLARQPTDPDGGCARDRGWRLEYDCMVFPGLYFLVHIDRKNWLKTTFVTAVLFNVTFGTLALLIAASGLGGFEPGKRLGSGGPEHRCDSGIRSGVSTGACLYAPGYPRRHRTSVI